MAKFCIWLPHTIHEYATWLFSATFLYVVTECCHDLGVHVSNVNKVIQGSLIFQPLQIQTSHVLHF